MDRGFDGVPEAKELKSGKGEFFGMSIKTASRMVTANAGAEELMAYMVLSRGVNIKGNSRISTHGANSISNRTGISYRRAEAALNFLEQLGIALKATGKDGAVSPKRQHSRWILQDEQIDIHLANALTDGIGEGKRNPPLMRIYTQVTLGNSGLMADARLDAVMVLIHLYLHQDIQGCGGVDPRAGIYREWVTSKNYAGEAVIDIEGTNAALYEIEGGNIMFTKFAAEALSYVPDVDERHARFWDAFFNLKRLGFQYEITQVWSDNPNGENGRKAELLYTLYVHDRHARESEPYLQRQIHEAAFRRDTMDRTYIFQDEMDEHRFINSGRFRFIAPKKAAGFPLGVYRLRFRPKTRDIGIGIEAEKHRVNQWAAELEKLH